jgi:hypothetical protein
MAKDEVMVILVVTHLGTLVKDSVKGWSDFWEGGEVMGTFIVHPFGREDVM